MFMSPCFSQICFTLCFQYRSCWAKRSCRPFRAILKFSNDPRSLRPLYFVTSFWQDERFFFLIFSLSQSPLCKVTCTSRNLTGNLLPPPLLPSQPFWMISLHSWLPIQQFLNLNFLNPLGFSSQLENNSSVIKGESVFIQYPAGREQVCLVASDQTSVQFFFDPIQTTSPPLPCKRVTHHLQFLEPTVFNRVPKALDERMRVPVLSFFFPIETRCC